MLDILKSPGLLPEKLGDPRWKQITIRQLLLHTAGFDKDASFDPMFRSYGIAKATDTPPPAEAETIIRFMLGRRLDFEPGTKHVYSNFGYCLLGRVIEQLTGKHYAEAVQRPGAPAGGHHADDDRANAACRPVCRARFATTCPTKTNAARCFPT